MQTETKLNNAVVQAAVETLAMTTGQDLNILPAQVCSQNRIENGVAITVNLVGSIQGYIRLRFTEEAAKQTASALMMGMPVEVLDEMSMSALSELGNMISGGTATHLSEAGIVTDITTPSVTSGEITFETHTVAIPLESSELNLSIDVSLDACV